MHSRNMENGENHKANCKMNTFKHFDVFLPNPYYFLTYTCWKVVHYSNKIRGFGIIRALESSWNLSSSFYCVCIGKLVNLSEL